MKRLLFVGRFLLGATSFLLALEGTAQQTGTTPSLGELARQLKAERAKEEPRAVKFFTNDNLPPSQLEASPSASAGPSASAQSQTGASADRSSAPAAGASEKHDEKYYRKAMADLRARKELHERELAVLEKKHDQNLMQYYPDPYKQAVQEYNRSDINQLKQDIDKKKQEIAADDKAMEDLQEQLRREGGPPGWLR